MQKKEQRKFIRLFVYHLVKYRLLSAGQDAPLLVATLRDIGGGGVCLRTREPLPASTIIELKINFPPLDTPLSTLTKVIWTRQRKKSSYYEIGLHFVEIDKAIQKNIDERIKTVYSRLKDKRRGLFKIFFRKGGGR
jgi:c-di-GMP-binding flagellar brake protein YcgR